MQGERESGPSDLDRSLRCTLDRWAAERSAGRESNATIAFDAQKKHISFQPGFRNGSNFAFPDPEFQLALLLSTYWILWMLDSESSHLRCSKSLILE